MVKWFAKLSLVIFFLLVLATCASATQIINITGWQWSNVSGTQGEIYYTSDGDNFWSYCVDRSHYIYQQTYFADELPLSTNGLKKAAWVTDNFAYSKIGSYVYNGVTYSGANLGAAVQLADWYLTGQMGQGYGGLWNLSNYLISLANSQSQTVLDGMAGKYHVLDVYTYNNWGCRVDSQDLLTPSPVPEPASGILLFSGLMGLLGLKRSRRNK